MSKKKTRIRKSIARRFKITKTGKVLRRSSFARHLRSKKGKSRLRRLKKIKVFKGKTAKKIKKLLGK
ncbi:50S ribosomal protein L35 [Candidatus Shapirobacteria bacterium CG10_big_fil_rev_8_21_14_0_10_40_9]|uniref:Large ribosomal subunit protein bL35 n=1 Tax=Candidatus Shapirobacteria bacterium CG10_big_fil_rev_8_21_14_0_10_40_9 TaxID=1974888 RepID=A0A2M8L471_9BACT|nr:MAG: 50S ribosomal protein L35 [Candidatus Shapirobacteria bacterium CG10_big_fil_rev_8_21_14_0_10_40_9]